MVSWPQDMLSLVLAARCNRYLTLIPALQSLANTLADIAAECTQQQAAAAGDVLEGAEGMTFASAPLPSAAGRPLRSSGSNGRGNLKGGGLRTGGGSRNSSRASRDSSQAASKRSSLDVREALQVGAAATVSPVKAAGQGRLGPAEP